ncbi:unnamed protein product [Lactuca saligna]|uniref:Uncharacterized protein n=1 Tax=Lactuca saligna TaxID=75948 RepID=A0AA36A0N0_LACSI|nr:unnamed protein product [Lactuca saligna]
MIFSEEPIVDNSEDEEPDENKLKRRKTREAKMDEHQRVIREAEVKEKAQHEAHVTLENRKLLFPKWTLKRIQNEVIEWRMSLPLIMVPINCSSRSISST